MTSRKRGLLLAALVMSLAACTDQTTRRSADLLGSWKMTTGTAILSFLPNSTAAILVRTPDVDRTTWYSWQVVDREHLRLKPTGPIRPSADLPGTSTLFAFSLSGEQLMLMGQDGTTRTYQKVH